MIQRNSDCMCGLDQGGGLTNEQQGVGPPQLAFEFSTSAEPRQLILRQRKDYNTWWPLAQLSNAVIIKAKKYNLTKRRSHMWGNMTFVYCSYVLPTQNKDNNARESS